MRRGGDLNGIIFSAISLTGPAKEYPVIEIEVQPGYLYLITKKQSDLSLQKQKSMAILGQAIDKKGPL